MTKSKISFPNQKGQSQEFIIEDYDDHIVLCAYCTDNIEDVDIPGTINNKPVTQIGDGCFMLHKEIVNVSFPDTLESIGVQAFALCSKIQELLFSDNIHEIVVREDNGDNQPNYYNIYTYDGNSISRVEEE